MPHIQVQIDSWFGLTMAVGFMLPFVILALTGGYILGTFVLGRFGKTVLGTHVRHVFTRIAPAKRFHPTDIELVELVIVDSLKKSGRIRELMKEHLK